MSFAERLIEEVRCHEILYNFSSAEYRNVGARDSVWKDIARRVGVSQEHAKKKWRNLRDTYNRNNRMELRSDGASPVNSRKWKYYKQMNFLDQFACPRYTIRNLDEVLPETVTDSFEVLSPEYSSSPLSPKRLEHEVVRTQFCKFLEKASQQLAEVSTSDTSQLFHALATRVENSGLTNEETGIVELAVIECVIKNIKKIKSSRPIG